MKGSTLATFAVPMLLGCQAEPTAGNETPDSANRNGIQQSPPEKVVRADGAADRYSQFTSIDAPGCRLLEENIEEGGWSRRLCDGLAGYKLELTDSDLRQDIIVIPARGQRRELGLTEIVANGAFNALGKTAEWRGTNLSAPDALIVRLGVAADPEGQKPDIRNLIVVRLKPTACIAAVVPPGPGQNERARFIADGKLPACLTS